MSIAFESVERINTLKNGIEAVTGESYEDLTAGVQALKNGYGKGGECKPEQEKTVDITENGTTEIVPDNGKTLSKVTVNVAVPSSGGGMGIIYSDFTGGTYNLPKKADISSLAVVSENLSASTMQSGNALFSYLFKNISSAAAGGFNAYLEEVECGDSLKFFGQNMFEYCSDLKILKGDFSKVVSIGTNAFYYCAALTQIPQMPSLRSINDYAFRNCTALTEVRFYSKPTISNNAFTGCSNLKDIYVPWAEREVANAPWGATNATIHYNSEV